MHKHARGRGGAVGNRPDVNSLDNVQNKEDLSSNENTPFSIHGRNILAHKHYKKGEQA